MENLDKILESLLFVAGEPVAISDITSKIDASKSEVEKAAKQAMIEEEKRSKAKYKEANISKKMAKTMIGEEKARKQAMIEEEKAKKRAMIENYYFDFEEDVK